MRDRLVASNISGDSCVEKTPLTSVLTAVRASTAAPMTLTRLNLKKIKHGKYVVDLSGHPYVDVGLLNNFPIEIFDDPEFIELNDDKKRRYNPHTLGIAFKSNENERNIDKERKANLLIYQLGAWINSGINKQHEHHMNLEG